MSVCISICSTSFTVLPVHAVEVSAPSVLLMEASTGKVIFEKESDERRSPASVTKVMTLLLIYEQIEAGKIALDNLVTTSAHAKSMGGSQVYLEEGEIQTVETLIKCITISSGNDASVAMAEYIAGTETDFVNLMNERAKELGMENTHFEDCCGLTDSDGHYTSARDVAIMSRELINNHPDILNYSKIWMEDITHTTNKGSSNFTLSSTNKLLKQYEWTTGLKTGHTSKAKFCISATALKDDIHLIAVIMGAETGPQRLSDAVSLFNYGFNVSSLYKDEEMNDLPPLKVDGGISEEVPLIYQEQFSYLDIEGHDLSVIEKEIKVPETAKAPIQKGDVAGEAVYSLNGTWIGSVPVLYGKSIEKAHYGYYIKRTFGRFLL